MAILIAGIQRSCACTCLVNALVARVAMPVAMVAVAVSMMTADETYQQYRIQAEETMEHCSQSNELKSRQECLR